MMAWEGKKQQSHIADVEEKKICNEKQFHMKDSLFAQLHMIFHALVI